jgi:hypothetical protein
VRTAGARAGNQQQATQPAATEADDAIEQFKHAVLAKLTLAVGKDAGEASDRDWFVATTLSLRQTSRGQVLVNPRSPV